MKNSEADRAIRAIFEHLEVLRKERPTIKLSAGRSAKGAQTVTDIIIAARTVFVRDGYPGLTFRTVAQEADLSVGNISYYFSSKDALAIATLQETFADYVEAHIRHIATDGKTPMEMLLDIVEFYVEGSQQAHPLFFQMWGYAGARESAKLTVRQLYRPVGRFVYFLVKAANPSLSHDEARRVVFQIFSLEQGMRLFISMGPEDDVALQDVGKTMREATRRLVLNS